jgi:AhpD family alkylhydroperoxidase
MPERPVPHPIAFRAVMVGLGFVQTVNGLWALFAPRSFYDDFPPGRGGWVSALPAYNEHLLRDVGGLFLATGVLLLVAGVLLERRLVWVSLVTWLLFALPHAVYHFFNLEPYDTADAVGNVITLALTVALPAALLVLLARPAAGPQAARGSAPANGGARIRGVERSSNPFVRYVFRESRKRFGKVPVPVAVTAHHPPLLVGYGMLELATERSHRVDERFKELAELKAAQLAGCEWCLDFGSALVHSKGVVTDEEMRALVDYADSDVLGPDDKLVLDYATAMSRTPVEVSDELFERLRARFDEAQLVELTSVIALENYRARFNWAFGIRGEGFSEGAYCVAPQGERAVGSAHAS